MLMAALASASKAFASVPGLSPCNLIVKSLASVDMSTLLSDRHGSGETASRPIVLIRGVSVLQSCSRTAADFNAETLQLAKRCSRRNIEARCSSAQLCANRGGEPRAQTPRHRNTGAGFEPRDEAATRCRCHLFYRGDANERTAVNANESSGADTALEIAHRFTHKKAAPGGPHACVVVSRLDPVDITRAQDCDALCSRDDDGNIRRGVGRGG